MSKSEIIMEVSHLTKKFPVGAGQQLTACDDVSLSIRRGKTTAIVGESGCGKSTLVKTILNMQVPTSGSVMFRGQDITQLTGEARRQNCQHIQLVFQDPTAAFDPKMKVREILCEPLLNFQRIAAGEMEAKARELLAMVELPGDFADRYPHSMSGGQRQRVAIARALALEPEIIACDEATSALDVSVQDTIIKLLVKLQREKGVTYLFICHDLALVSLFSHRIVVMYLGNVMEKLDGDKLAEAKHPYTRALLQSIFPVHGAQEAIQGIDGEIPSPLDIPPGCPFQNRCTVCQARCRAEKPQLRQVGPDHFAACHFID